VRLAVVFFPFSVASVGVDRAGEGGVMAMEILEGSLMEVVMERGEGPGGE